MMEGVNTRFAILALQRTGTNMLGSILRKTGKVHMYGEIFYPGLGKGDIANNVSNGLFFPDWLDQINKNPKKLLITNLVISKSILSDFLDIIFDQHKKNITGVDIKYEQLEVFPQMFDLIRKKNMKVIHIERQNYLARIISHVVLNYRVKSGEMDTHHSIARVPPLAVDPAHLLRWIKEDEVRNSTLNKKFSDLSDMYINVNYEDMINGGHALRRIFDFLGLADEPIPPPDTVKQAPPDFASQIANYREVATALEQAGYGAFLEHG